MRIPDQAECADKPLLSAPSNAHIERGTTALRRAIAAHESEAYQRALQALGSGADRDFRILEAA